jgi:hypothetical protein
MLEKLVKRVCDMAPEQLAHAHLEDMGLCASWLDSFRDEPEWTEPYRSLRQQFDLWVTIVETPSFETAGKRQQPFLRRYIDRVIEGDSPELDRDEVDFVYFCWGLAHRTAGRGLFTRVVECLKPYIEEVESRRKEVPLRPGLPTLAESLGLFFREDFRMAESRDIKVFAGLDFPLRGPVLIHKGIAKFADGIPSDAVAVVEEGHCTVNGPVLGKLAVPEGCDILDNVSGVVVSRQGTIRARNIIKPATVVAKEGSIFCVGADFPKLAYAAETLGIAGDAQGGQYRCGALQLSGKLSGGELHVSGEGEGQHFGSSEDKPMAIVLRRTLNCRDYGEVMTPEGLRLLTNALHLRQLERNVSGLIRISTDESDEYAGMALAYLFGDEDVSDEVRGIESMRRQVAILDRLEAAAKSLAGNIDDWLALNTDASDMSDDRGGFVEDLRRDLSMLKAEGSIEPEVSRHQEEVLDLGKKTFRRGLKRTEALRIMRRLLEKEEAISLRSKEITTQIQHQEQVFERLVSQHKVLSKARDEQRRAEILKQLVLAARKNPNETLRRRAGERYVQLMLRYIEGRRSRISEYNTRIKKIEGDIDTIRGKLWKVHQVSLPLHVLRAQDEEPARITGSFDSGIRICAWQHLVAEGHVDERSAVLTPEGDERVHTYLRTGHGSIRRI